MHHRLGLRPRTLGALAACLLVSGTAWGWQSSVLFRATVWSHQFTEVSVQPSECVVVTTVKYKAPDKAYKSRLEGMNEYRFKVRARFASGKSATSGVFTSTKAGSATHSYRVDTRSEACWAGQHQKLVAMDVEGCRGAGCAVQPFK